MANSIEEVRKINDSFLSYSSHKCIEKLCREINDYEYVAERNICAEENLNKVGTVPELERLNKANTSLYKTLTDYDRQTNSTSLELFKKAQAAWHEYVKVSCSARAETELSYSRDVVYQNCIYDKTKEQREELEGMNGNLLESGYGWQKSP